MIMKKRVIALGFFDGVHVGHAALLNRALEVGSETGLIPSVITLDVHPQLITRGKEVLLINSLEDRLSIIHRVFGIEDVLPFEFNTQTAAMPWDMFIDYLIDEFGAKHLIAGADFKFGFGGMGNSRLLLEKCDEKGIGCDIIPHVKQDGIVCSSTYIRELLLSGDIKRANSFLGHAHILTDIVRHGYKLGRTLGTPTINMCFSAGVLVPAHGVYATRIFLEDGAEQIGVTNVGIRPTVSGTDSVTAETHILNFQRNLYGHKVRVEFHKRLRSEIRFDGIDKLKAQIAIDCEEAMRFFG
ncbi:MAG: riboflavin biosynthesis protein RibF [Oscillospiraceae bacterium]|nr:riboflavin biosynthesis protein RibF [Oscillospiraceae bacterium]